MCDALGKNKAVFPHRCGWISGNGGGIPGTILVSLGVLVVLVLAGWGANRLLNPPQVAMVVPVKKGKATAAVYGTLSVQPEQQILIKSRTSGVVRSMPISVGQTVKQGDILAEIVDEQLVNELERSQLDLKAAEDKLAIGPPSTNELNSRTNEMQRLEPLVKDKTISPLEYERVKSLVDDLARRVAQEKLSMEQEVDLARKQLDNVQGRIGQSTVRSPLDGVILQLDARLAETITSGAPVALVGSRECNLLANVNEEDVGMLRPGMRAQVRLYSFGDKGFDAEVVQVLPKADNQTYGVVLSMPDEEQKKALLPGMTGEANIIVGQRDDALIIPARAVREGDRVFVVDGKTVRISKVKTGFRSVEECEILEGLSEGELVIVSDQDRFAPGERVAVKLAGG